MNIFLVEMDAYNPATSSVVTLKFATRQLGDWEERMRSAGFVRRDMFAQGTTFGRSAPSFGDIELINSALLDAEGDLDFLNDYAFDGRDIAVYWGPSDGSFPSDFTLLYAATMEQVLVARDRVTVRILGNQARVDLPFRDTFYTGTGDTGGDDNLANKPKPYTFGQVDSISPVLINATNKIYQVHDGAINALTVYDRGKVLSAGTALEWSSSTGLVNDAKATRAYAENDSGSIGIFVDDTTFKYTTDKGYTWSGSTSYGSVGMQDVAKAIHADGRFYVFGEPNNTGDYSPIIYSETDGNGLPDITSWYSTNLDLSSGLTVDPVLVDAAYSPDLGVIVAVGGSTNVGDIPLRIYYCDTSNPGTWTSAGSFTEEVNFDSTLSNGLAVVWVGGSIQEFRLIFRDVSVGPAVTRVWGSADGASWVELSTTSNKSGFFQLLYVEDTDTTYMVTADGTDYDLQSSTDGLLTFTNELNGIGRGGTSITPRLAYVPNAGFYIPAGSGVVHYSQDGATWTTTTSLPAEASGFDAFGGFLLAVGYRGYAPAAYQTLGDMFDADAAPGLNEYKTYLAGGLFRLGSSAGGQVVCDVTVGATAADRTVAKAFTTVLDKVGEPYDSTAVDALDSVAPYECGFYLDINPVNTSQILDQIANSVGAFWGDDSAGIFTIAQVDAPEFDPSSLFGSGIEGVWYDPSDLSTMWQDSAGTVPVTGPNQPVGKLADKSGNGNDATQSTSTKRPILRESEGLYWLEFDGVDDVLETGLVDLTYTDAVTLVGGVTRLDNTLTRPFFEFGDLPALNGSFAVLTVSGGAFRGGSRGTTARTADSAVYSNPVTLSYSLVADISQPIVALNLNGSLAASNTDSQGTGNYGNRNVYLGGRPRVSWFFRGHIYETIMVGAAVATATVAKAETYVARSIGTSLGAIPTVRDYDMTKPLERLTTQDLGRGVPFWRVALNYARRYTTISSDFDASVTDAERLRLSTPFDTEAYSDSGILTVHPLSQELIVDTLLTDSTDAVAEAERVFDLRSVKRDRYQFEVKLDDSTVAWDVGDVIRIVHPRFGLASGKNFLIIGLTLNPGPQTVTVNVWG